MNGFDAALVLLAAAMAVVTAFLIRWASEAPDRLGRGVVLFLLVMMTSMSGAAALYFTSPSSASLVEAAALSGGLMLAAAGAVFLLFLREAGSRARAPRSDATAASPATAPAPTTPSWTFLASVAGLVLLGEFLMGWGFQIATAPGSLSVGGDPTVLVSGVVNSPWFLFTMAAEMGLTTYLLRARLGRAFLPVLALQALIMALSPTALPNASLGNVSLNWGNGTVGVLALTWPNLTVALGSVAMIGLFIYQMEHIYRHPELPRALGRYFVLLVGVYGLMMAGLFVYLNYGDERLFALSILAEMVLYLGAALLPGRFDAEDVFPWQLRANWAAAFLSGIFVAELFMGAVLDMVLEPQTYAGGWPALPLSGPALTVATNVFWNGFTFFAEAAGSTWFLVMMGSEMGMLVVFKIRESTNLENKVRMVLMMGCYFAFATFFPSWYYNQLFPAAPPQEDVAVLGWSMGIGTDTIAPPLFLVIALTYAITGVLCFLFGRRVICSVFCTAPLMYQGTTFDAMKTFNRHSRVARKYLGSKLGNLYIASTGVVMGSLLVASVLSYTDGAGLTNIWVGPYGLDPTVFLFTISFSVLWYLMFVAIPYVGNYNCVTMGWCYTGTIAQFFQKLGPYKLKVRDRQVCRDCTTLDCAKACPVGLVDMPGHFRTQGEFRSSKCCGVGACVGVCPYGNLYIHDIRHWVLERIRARQLPPAASRLPMVSTKPARPSPSAGTAPVPEGASPVLSS